MFDVRFIDQRLADPDPSGQPANLLGQSDLQPRLLALEARVRELIGNGFLANVARIRQMLADEDPTLRATVLAYEAPALSGTLLSAVSIAFGVGVEEASGILGRNAPTVDMAAPDTYGDAIGALDERSATIGSTIQVMAGAGADDELLLLPLFALAASLGRLITLAVNDAGNEGSIAVADAAAVPLVWIAEPDACVDCLAYSGQVCDPGDEFPGGLTYAVLSPFSDAIPGPPLHPNCRCTVEPLGDSSFPEALQREAVRSILRGFSLPGESMTTRVDAAGRLLASGPDAPKSVLKYAAAAVKDGRFPTRGR